MGLNHLMHARNIYKNRPPDFRALAEKYVDFRRFTTFAPSGKVHFDFHNPEAVRCLTEKLLKDDFGLDVILPPDSLVPRVPQRLNYILLIEDLLKAGCAGDEICGIDIGTGASCVYPLLGTGYCRWSFCATEVNDASMTIAQENVRRNGFADKITIIRGHETTIFKEIVSRQPETHFDFSMCNPPFFDEQECRTRFQPAQNSDFRNQPGPSFASRPGPQSATVAKQGELCFLGGEVAFVSLMIHESQVFRNHVGLFTSMIGKKKSLGPLKKLLDDFKFVSFTSHPLSQGKTQRWVLVWTFDPCLKVDPEMITQKFSLRDNDFLTRLEAVCRFARVETLLDPRGILSCSVLSSAMTFKPWRRQRRPSTSYSSSEWPPVKKKSRPSTFEVGTQTPFSSDLNCGNLCDAGNVNLFDATGQEIGIQCSAPSQKPPNARYMRLFVSASGEATFLRCDEPAFRWLRSVADFYERTMTTINDG